MFMRLAPAEIRSEAGIAASVLGECHDALVSSSTTS
jgi:hypothetical protein